MEIVKTDPAEVAFSSRMTRRRNSSLTFADIQFLEINQEIAAILKLSEIGNVDWQQLLLYMIWLE